MVIRLVKIVYQITHFCDADHRGIQIAGERLYCRLPVCLGTWGDLLTTHGDDAADNVGAGAVDECRGITNRFARGEHVVYEQHPPRDRCANQTATFTVILGFFAVVRDAYITASTGKGNRGSNRDGYSFVGRTEQNIEFKPLGFDRLGIRLSQRCKRRTAADFTEIEEIWADPPGVERKLAELQYLLLQQEVDERYFTDLRQSLYILSSDN